MPTSMLEYLAALRKHGHTPRSIGTAQIGRTVYAAGLFTSPERDAPAGSRAAAEGRNIPAEDRLALMPMYRTDRVTRDSTGPTPALFPASYARSRKTTFIDPTGKTWYIAGWDKDGEVMWLNDAAWMDEPPVLNEHVNQRMQLSWDSSFDAAMSLAGPEVLARIEAAEQEA